MVLLKNSFLRRYSNTKFEKFDTAQSQIFLTCYPLKMLIKNVGLCCNSKHIILKKCNILIEGKERPAKTKLFQAKLRTVLDTSGSAVKLLLLTPGSFILRRDQLSARSRTWCSITLRGVGLGAVLAIFGFSKYFRFFFKMSSHRF